MNERNKDCELKITSQFIQQNWEQRDLVRSDKKGAIAKNSFQYK
jgi:hypothetical protein